MHDYLLLLCPPSLPHLSLSLPLSLLLLLPACVLFSVFVILNSQHTLFFPTANPTAVLHWAWGDEGWSGGAQRANCWGRQGNCSDHILHGWAGKEEEQGDINHIEFCFLQCCTKNKAWNSAHKDNAVVWVFYGPLSVKIYTVCMYQYSVWVCWVFYSCVSQESQGPILELEKKVDDCSKVHKNNVP